MSTRGFVLIAALWPVATVAQRSQPVGADSLASMDLGVTIECYFPPQPELVGAMDALMESIHYPPEAIEAGVEGRVFVQVVVDEDGRASQIEIARSPDFRLNDEALRVASLARFRWPDGVEWEERHARWSLPITFRIPENDQEVKVEAETKRAH